jgi:predicted acylesterase/phospholipase RssA
MSQSQTTAASALEFVRGAMRRKVEDEEAKVDPEAGFAHARVLAGAQYLDYACWLAREIARGLRPEHDLAIELRQKWALWTSQNPDAPDDQKHDEALGILDAIGGVGGGASLAETSDPETLGIAGGICKRKWNVDGQRQALEASLGYYLRGMHTRGESDEAVRSGIEADQGYTAINAAYAFDLLAATGAVEADSQRERARAIRETVRDTLISLQGRDATAVETRWFDETLAEAHFGLGEYDEATARLRAAYARGGVEPWEREAAARQFAVLARLHDPDVTSSEQFEHSKAWGVLREVWGASPTAGAGSLFAGKLGLGLSGGGFRASLYHIGVLAALAERDMLRHVEALSCVSGGSILGAHYYLEVRKLLEAKRDEAITREDYIELVERLARDFLAGVQKNIRTRVAGNLLSNLRMMFQPGYTRTSRLGELYEEHLYARVRDDGERRLRELKIRPVGTEGFKPKYDNWERANKVPMLILNATALNTGHNWQFTTSWMGESPAAIDSQIDGNYRLRRMYYQDAPGENRDVTIGQAAAASSCVPGLFTPIELRDLYEGVTVRLVDGGVHDNQGIFGLLDQNCTVMIISDASGQIGSVEMPPDDPIGVLLRTTGMLQARVRTAEYREVETRRRSGRLKGLLFLHLKKDLQVEDRDWIGCEDPKERRESPSEKTGYRVLKRFQRMIANIRTDLDSFSDVEAGALMTSGYNMLDASFDDHIDGFATSASHHDWRFLAMAKVLNGDDPDQESRMEKLLGVASMLFFKVWKLVPGLRALAFALGAALVLGLLWALVSWHAEPFMTPKGITAAVALTALTVALGRLGLEGIVRLVQYRKTVHQILMGAALSVVGWLGALVHIEVFDASFLKRGSLGDKSSEK